VHSDAFHKSKAHQLYDCTYCAPFAGLKIQSLIYKLNRISIPTFSYSSPMINNPLHLIHILHGRRQILIPFLRNQDIILDSNTSYVPVLIQYIEIDICCMNGISEIRLDDESAEINLDYN
jgi:hypothetical protein